MTGGGDQKLAVVLLAMGGPDGPDDIKEYLNNIFSDRSIIRLPGGTIGQILLSKLIVSRRVRAVREHYSMIGGSSPLLKWTKAQAEHIERELFADYPGIKCFVGMRYFHPTISNTIKEAYDSGYRRFCFLPMYPQYSTATTGSSFTEIDKSVRAYADITAQMINDFHAAPEYTSLLRDYIDNNIGENDTLLFSAHSLPKSFVDGGDPYVDQIETTARMAAGQRDYHLSYQSRTGPVEWVGPNTIDETKRLLRETSGDIFIVPISFVCDHIETLYEIDIELKNLVAENDSSRLKRMPMFNDDPRFGKVLANLVRRKVEDDGAG